MSSIPTVETLLPGALGAILFVATGCAPRPCPPPPPAAATPTVGAPQPPSVMVPIVNVASGTSNAAADPAVMNRLPELPRPSPDAELKQRVGITTMHVTYSSPAAKGRTIWGKLVPYGKPWRTGANAPTKVHVNRAFTFGGKDVPAGKYSLITIPGDKKWAVILNKDPENQGAFEHDPKHDVARVEVTAVAAPARERLAFLFENTTDVATDLVLEWAGLRVAVPMTVKTAEHIDASIAATMKTAWRPLFNAGRHHYDKGELPAALSFFDKSVAIHETWWNHWWAAQTLAKQNQHAKARVHAEKAMELGKDDRIFKRAFLQRVKKALAAWPQS